MSVSFSDQACTSSTEPDKSYKVEPLDLDAEAVLKLMFINSSSFTFTKTKSTVAQNRETEIFHINQVVHHFNNKKPHQNEQYAISLSAGTGVFCLFSKESSPARSIGGMGGGGSKDFFSNLLIKNEISRSCTPTLFCGHGKSSSNCIMTKAQDQDIFRSQGLCVKF